MSAARPEAGAASRGGFPVVRVGGDARERSRRYGELARAQVAATRDAYERAFAGVGIDWAEAVGIAERHLPAVERFCPELLEEIRGIAEGSGQSFADILAINCRTEVLHTATTAQARALAGFRGECSSFALEPHRSETAGALLGQNWDWLESVEHGVIVLEVEREDGPNYVSIVEAGLLAKTSLTQHGLAVGLNTLVSSLDGDVEGVPYHFTIRALLESRHLAHAVEILSSMPRASSANFMLAMADGAILNLETAPGDARGISPQIGDGALVHANHFLDPLPGGHDLAPLGMSDSYNRHRRMRRSFLEAEGRMSLAQVHDALSDHVEWPNSVCCHPDPDESGHSRWKTLASVIADPAARRISYTAGPPCESERHLADYAELLGAG